MVVVHVFQGPFLHGQIGRGSYLLLKYEEVNYALKKYGMECMESMTSFMAMICELLFYKVARNNSFQEGRHAEVVEHYTTALACNGES